MKGSRCHQPSRMHFGQSRLRGCKVVSPGCIRDGQAAHRRVAVTWPPSVAWCSAISWPVTKAVRTKSDAGCVTGINTAPAYASTDASSSAGVFLCLNGVAIHHIYFANVAYLLELAVESWLKLTAKSLHDFQAPETHCLAWRVGFLLSGLLSRFMLHH